MKEPKATSVARQAIALGNQLKGKDAYEYYAQLIVAGIMILKKVRGVEFAKAFLEKGLEELKQG